MPLIALLRPLFGLLSIVILFVAGALLWTWYEGDTVQGVDGVLYFVREDWRLWTGLGLLAWSFLGRIVTTPLLARGDKGPKTKPERGTGQMIAGAAGSQLYVEVHGVEDGPTIILTHGWGLDSTIWSYAKRALEKDFRLIVWDLPGLGRSKSPPHAIDLPHFAADLGALIEWSGDEPVVLVGHSIGGMTIQTLARDHAELFDRRVAGAVLVNTTYTNPLRTMIFSRLVQALRRPIIEPMMRLTIWLQPLSWLMAWQGYLSGSAHMANRLGFGKFVTHSQLEHTTLLATRNPPAAQAKGNLAMFRWDATEALLTLPGPVLVVGGDMDIVTKLGASEAIAETAPDARLLVVTGVNHMGFLEQADLYNAAISDFAQVALMDTRTAPAGYQELLDAS